ncbi:Fic family protein [Streptomyces sp. NPDC054837]
MSTPAPDHLRTWLTLRATIPWHRARTAPHPVAPARDGAAHDIRTHDHARSPQRAERLLAALTRARADAASPAPLDFALLAGWQRHVLGTPEPPPFRSDPAHAKSGRERYGTGPDLPALLDACLAETQDRADDPALPLTARAARAYLDVCFFHPFDDGNARSAFLTLTFVLARAGVSLDQVGPVRRIRRRADDPEGALALADLLAVLITAAAGRRAPGDPACRPSPASSDRRRPRGTA